MSFFRAPCFYSLLLSLDGVATVALRSSCGMFMPTVFSTVCDCSYVMCGVLFPFLHFRMPLFVCVGEESIRFPPKCSIFEMVENILIAISTKISVLVESLFVIENLINTHTRFHRYVKSQSFAHEIHIRFVQFRTGFYEQEFMNDFFFWQITNWICIGLMNGGAHPRLEKFVFLM